MPTKNNYFPVLQMINQDIILFQKTETWLVHLYQRIRLYLVCMPMPCPRWPLLRWGKSITKWTVNLSPNRY